jgi:hypothetical protein
MIFTKAVSFQVGFLLLFQVELAAQDPFEGVITYQVKSSINPDQGSQLPKYTEYRIRGYDMIIQMTGTQGQEMARILIKGEARAFYMIDDAQKTAMKVRVREEDIEEIGNVPDEFREEYEKGLEKAGEEFQLDQFNLEKTGETMSIAGYICEKYIVKAENEAAFIAEVWLTDKIRVMVPDALKDQNNPLLVFMNENGFPLKLTGSSGGRPEAQAVEMTAVKVSRIALDPSEFVIPDNYHISDLTGLLEGN